MRWLDLRTAAAITRRELQLSTRGATFWSLAVGGGLYALWRATTPQTTAALACYQVVQLATIGLGVVAVLVGGAAAGRDARDKSLELVLSKPVGTTARLLLARFIGTWVSLLAVVAIMLVLVFAGQLLTHGTPWNLTAYGNALIRAVVPLALAVALGFTLATLFTPLAAAAAAAYWIVVPLARTQIPAIFDFTPAQHWPVAALLTAALLSLAIARQGIAIAGKTPSRRTAAWASAGLFVATGVAVLLTIGQGEDMLLRPYRVLEAISAQGAQEGKRAPGFWLSNAQGRMVGLSDFDGEPVAILFWAPAEAASARALPAATELARRYGKQGLRCIVVCVDRDSATLAPFAKEVGPDVVMLWDRGRHFNAAQPLLDSPLANAYAVEQVPVGFVLARDHRLASAAFSDIDGLGLGFEHLMVQQ